MVCKMQLINCIHERDHHSVCVVCSLWKQFDISWQIYWIRSIDCLKKEKKVSNKVFVSIRPRKTKNYRRKANLKSKFRFSFHLTYFRGVFSSQVLCIVLNNKNRRKNIDMQCIEKIDWFIRLKQNQLLCSQ